MRVLTSNPIVYNNRLVRKDVRKILSKFSSADGDPKILAALNKRQVQGFQDYMNIKYPTWYIPNKGTMPKDSPKYGDKSDSWTITAWKIYGDAWYKAAMGIADIAEKVNPFSLIPSFSKPKTFIKPKTKQVSTSIQPVQEEKKPMTTTTKVIIGVSGVVVLGTLIYLITKK
jgi:hypothetical protein